MEDAERRPLIGISACRSEEAIHPFNRVSEKYILAILDPTCGTPVIIPAIQDMGSEIDHSDSVSYTHLTLPTSDLV